MIPSTEMRLYHTGIIVDSLDEAMRTYGEALGVHWAPPRTAETPMRCPTGVVGRKVRFTYSIEGPHHIELLEQIDPTPYLPLTGGRFIHHLGYFARDLAGAADWLNTHGFVMELNGVTEAGAISRATFHRSPLSPGIWVELVDQDLADWIAEWLSEAAAEQGIPFKSPFAWE
jgi:hypothetical protein